MRLLTLLRERRKAKDFLTKEVILFISILILWVVEIFHCGQMSNFDFGLFSTWIFEGIGAAFLGAFVGIIIGSFISFIFRAKKEISLNYYDKIIFGIWLVIIFRLINLFI